MIKLNMFSFKLQFLGTWTKLYDVWFDMLVINTHLNILLFKNMITNKLYDVWNMKEEENLFIGFSRMSNVVGDIINFSRYCKEFTNTFVFLMSIPYNICHNCTFLLKSSNCFNKTILNYRCASCVACSENHDRLYPFWSITSEHKY